MRRDYGNRTGRMHAFAVVLFPQTQGWEASTPSAYWAMPQVADLFGGLDEALSTSREWLQRDEAQRRWSGDDRTLMLAATGWVIELAR